jgi:hypothetical protein
MKTVEIIAAIGKKDDCLAWQARHLMEKVGGGVWHRGLLHIDVDCWLLMDDKGGLR